MSGQSHSATSTIPLCGHCGRPVLGTMVVRGTMVFHLECTQPPTTQCPDCAAKDKRIAELEAQPVFRLHPMTWPCDQCGGNVEHRVPVGSKLLCYECAAARIAKLEAENAKLREVRDAASQLEYVLDLFDICETGVGRQERYNLRQALQATTSAPTQESAHDPQP